jgi:hypothetical protein
MWHMSGKIINHESVTLRNRYLTGKTVIRLAKQLESGRFLAKSLRGPFV